MKRLAIVTTHPIQYNAPLFQLLESRGIIKIHVYYTWSQSQKEVYDEKFAVKRSWDVPLLDGYTYEFVHNTSFKPDSNRFFGIINPGLKKKINTRNFDAVLIYRWSVWSHLKLMFSIRGKTKLWFRGDSHLHSAKESFIKKIIKQTALRIIYGKVDLFFYAGRMNQQYFRHYGADESRLVYMPHAIDNTRFIKQAEQSEQKAQEERRRLGIGNDDIVFIYAGKFYEIKNLRLLIKTFLSLKGTQYRLLLYGSGIEEQELKEMASHDERILFQPFQNQSAMPWVYRTGDVYVLPSKSETWGLGVNEAMACGLPAIVSSNCGCAPELIIEGKTGFVFDLLDGNGLLNQLQKFTSRSTANILGAQAHQHIQQFSLEKQAEVIENNLLNSVE